MLAQITFTNTLQAILCNY